MKIRKKNIINIQRYYTTYMLETIEHSTNVMYRQLTYFLYCANFKLISLQTLMLVKNK